MVFEGVDEFLGDVVLDGAEFFAEVDVEILGDVHVRAALIVSFGFAVEFGSFDISIVAVVSRTFF